MGKEEFDKIKANGTRVPYFYVLIVNIRKPKTMAL